MAKENKRSGCPVSSSLDIWGDKWSLLIVRDLMYAKECTYGDFLRGEEKIATNAGPIHTIIEIHFPVLYGDDFFTLFGADRWFKLRNVITEIKKRRGKSQMRIVFSFQGVSGASGTTTRLILQTSETD